VLATGLRVLTFPPARRSRLRAPLGVPKAVAWGPAYDLAEVKAAARAHGCSVNDLLLAAVAGALRHYLLARGERARDVRVLVPVDLRPPGAPVPTDLGNRIGVALVRLPVGQPDRADRVTALRGRCAAGGCRGGRDARPASGHRRAAREHASGCRSPPRRALPGDRHQRARARRRGHARRRGRRGGSVLGPAGGPRRLGISIFGYAGGVSVGVAADVNVVPDPEALVAAVAAEVHALLDMRSQGRRPDAGG
jgi:hypothetical protein